MMLIREVFLPNPREFGEIEAGPRLYIHYTESEASLRGILTKGFDLRYFGATAKRFRMPDLAADDPKGVYATEFNGATRDDPYVVFKLDPTPNVLTKPDPDYPGSAVNLKSELAHAYGCAGAKLSKILLKSNIQVVHSTHEYIILDPRRIVVVSWFPKISRR